jgi:hypothetical protein
MFWNSINRKQKVRALERTYRAYSHN